MNPIKIKKSTTADTRSCDPKTVTKEMLLAASVQHIDDVRRGLHLFGFMLMDAGANHDADKITEIDAFHRDFVHGFEEPYTSWWQNHRRVNRHHLTHPDGRPTDVNLIDVLDYITDCVMASRARGTDFPIELDNMILQHAFANTVALLKSKVVVEE